MNTAKPDPEKKLHDILSNFDKIDKVQLALEIQKIILTNDLVLTKDLIEKLDETEKFRLRMLMKLTEKDDNYLAAITSIDRGPF